jgi:PAS domain S-box-containing protein
MDEGLEKTVSALRLGLAEIAELCTVTLLDRGMDSSGAGAQIQQRLAQLAAMVDGLEGSFQARLEQLMAEEGRRTRKLLNTIPDMIGHWDRNLNNITANDAYVQFFGKRPEEIAGRHISWLLGEALTQKNLPHMLAALRGDTQVFEREIPLPDGKNSKYTLARYIPEVENGKVQGFYAVVTDVTPLYAQRRQLEEAKRQLAEAQHIAKIGSWSWNLRCEEFSWSAEHYRIFDIVEPQEPRTLRQAYGLRIHPEDRHLWDQMLASACVEGRGFTSELRLVMSDKTIKYVQMIGQVNLGSDQKPMVIDGTCQDVTERVHREEK